MFLKLTSDYHGTVYVNAAHIQSVSLDRDDWTTGGSRINFIGENGLYVRETPEQILAMISSGENK